MISPAQDEQDENYLEEELGEYLEDDWFLGEIEPTNLDSVNILIDLISSSFSRDAMFSAAWSLREIDDKTFFFASSYRIEKLYKRAIG